MSTVRSKNQIGKSPSKYHLPLNFTILIVLPDSSVHVPTYLMARDLGAASERGVVVERTVGSLQKRKLPSKNDDKQNNRDQRELRPPMMLDVFHMSRAPGLCCPR
jgi:hypothetical protein